ncbi:MAG: hypothetical protein RR818_01340 [Citrobacter sp.]
MANPKPLSKPEREIVRKLAAVLVCADLEVNMVSRFYEEKTGKPYNRDSPDSYLNQFLNNNPQYRRLWSLLQKDINTCRHDMAEGLRRERGK